MGSQSIDFSGLNEGGGRGEYVDVNDGKRVFSLLVNSKNVKLWTQSNTPVRECDKLVVEEVNIKK